jgi:2-methylcitrate dehydratase
VSFVEREVSMTAVEEMAAFAVNARRESLTNTACLQLKIRVLDTLGCALAALDGVGVRATRQFASDFAPDGPCTLIGGGASAPDRAALVNGALVRYLDFNDSYVAPRQTCHPSDNLAAVLAAAELARTDGMTFLTALAVAYQVQCRLSDAAPLRQRGFDHTTHLAYSVAAGVSRALSLDLRHAANAIAISGTALNALRVSQTGTLSQWKTMAAPFVASAATQATLLAQRGMTGPAELLEGNKGFMQVVAGSFIMDWSSEGFDRIERTVIKRYSGETHAQTAIDAALSLQRAHGFGAADIVKIEVEVFDVAHRIIGGGEEGDKTLVFTKEDAEQSLPYLIAVALIDHAVTPTQCAPRRVPRADVQALLCRVTVRTNADFSQRFPNEMPSRVSVTLHDGQVVTNELADYAGFHTRPQSWADAVAKFTELAVDRLSVSRSTEVASAVSEIETIKIAELTALLQEPRKSAFAPSTRRAV